MDTELQIRLNFLEEAEEFIDRIESALLELSTAENPTQSLDQALRAAHSLKGGAATMGFSPLSHLAHRLEDYFKILRVRTESHEKIALVEPLLLQGVDTLRQLHSLHQEAAEIGDEWLKENTDPIFEQLKEYLGELQEEDENALMTQDEGGDPSLLLFEEGLESVLESLPNNIATLPPSALYQEVLDNTTLLAEFGRMAKLDTFVELCHALRQHLATTPPDQIKSFAQRTLELWERAQAMVLLGQSEKLKGLLTLLGEVPAAPNPVEDEEQTVDSHSVSTDIDALADFGSPSDLGSIQDAFANMDVSNLDLPASLEAMNSPEEIEFLEDQQLVAETESLDLSGVQDAFSNLDLGNLTIPELPTDIGSIDEATLSMEEAQPFAIESQLEEGLINNLTDVNLSEVQAAFSNIVLDELDIPELSGDTSDSDAAELANSIETASPPSDQPQQHELVPAKMQQSSSDQVAETKAQAPSGRTSTPAQGQAASRTIRVSVEDLRQFNTLFKQLILERNTISQRLGQVQNYVNLMHQRMEQLEASNTQMRKWYDRASMEGVIAVTSDAPPSVQPSNLQPIQPKPLGLSDPDNEFDALEMDRYTDLHLLSQEQMETIVQLREVTSDIDLGFREISQSASSLNQITRSLQTNVTRTQMSPIGDILKRFPRMLRDLSRKHDKPVQLKIEGDTILLDRAILKSLSDPLMHLIRNAFDHGLEDAETRVAAGKPAQGSITVSAANRGNITSISIRDDGDGINLDKIRERGLQMGLPDEFLQECTEQDLINLIFEPGFSTSTQVTELSGRGVGMDVVRSNIEAIRGTVVVDTKPGQGTTFTINVPFMLSVVRVMLLEAGGMVFAVPADNIQEVFPFEEHSVQTINNQDQLEYQGGSLSLFRLENFLNYRRSNKQFSLEGKPKVSHPMVLVPTQQTEAGLYIQYIWGEQEVATTPISCPVDLPPGFTSSTVLGNGLVIPVIDPTELAKWLVTAPMNEQPGKTAAQAMRQAQSNSILVVDDSVNVRRYLAMTLEKAGYQVEQAKDGQEAVDMLLGGLRVSAVISDIEMPRLDGFGVLSELRSRAEFETLPITMLTSRSSDRHRKLAKRLGASAYLTKPYTEKELLQTIVQILTKDATPVDRDETVVQAGERV